MNAQDLRIGNLVYKRGNHKDVYIADFITIRMPENYEGIPLSEDWLLKGGFENDGKEDAGWFNLKEPLFGITYFIEGEWQHIWDSSYTDAPCNYVHQLQNLYFALTGQELEFNL